MSQVRFSRRKTKMERRAVSGVHPWDSTCGRRKGSRSGQREKENHGTS